MRRAARRMVGPFGTLLYCGTRLGRRGRSRRRSMELMATEVLPRGERAARLSQRRGPCQPSRSTARVADSAQALRGPAGRARPAGPGGGGGGAGAGCAGRRHGPRRSWRRCGEASGCGAGVGAGVAAECRGLRRGPLAVPPPRAAAPGRVGGRGRRRGRRRRSTSTRRRTARSSWSGGWSASSSRPSLAASRPTGTARVRPASRSPTGTVPRPGPAAAGAGAAAAGAGVDDVGVVRRGGRLSAHAVDAAVMGGRARAADGRCRRRPGGGREGDRGDGDHRRGGSARRRRRGVGVPRRGGRERRLAARAGREAGPGAGEDDEAGQDHSQCDRQRAQREGRARPRAPAPAGRAGRWLEVVRGTPRPVESAPGRSAAHVRSSSCDGPDFSVSASTVATTDAFRTRHRDASMRRQTLRRRHGDTMTLITDHAVARFEALLGSGAVRSAPEDLAEFLDPYPVRRYRRVRARSRRLAVLRRGGPGRRAASPTSCACRSGRSRAARTTPTAAPRRASPAPSSSS